ncbi:LPS translocon maturation chaperone LptM [Candidatus Regiella insecticola]|uniref:LPS translocon maturation chaperone LptM n=1 Tax=Candidatus Regiella insecticola TaxID=138073 RepID=UPI0002E102CF|nr:lipoprotein [Candidatus Regiella insecticola]
MKKKIQWLMVTIISLGLVGCGFKGALYPASPEKKVKITTVNMDIYPESSKLPLDGQR